MHVQQPNLCRSAPDRGLHVPVEWLERVATAPAWSLTVQEQAGVVVALTRARAGLDELVLRVLAATDRNDVASLTAATSTTAWLAQATVRAPGAAYADVKLADALDTGCDATRVALATGVVDLDQTRIIVHAIATLPADAVAEEPGLPARAEAHLLGLARTLDAKKLKHAARHLLAVLDPDGADERLGRALEAEEERASQTTSLVVRDNGDGTHTATARIPTLHAVMLKKALEAILNPRRHATVATVESDDTSGGGMSSDVPSLSRPEQLGHAFCDLLARMPAHRLPQQAGVSATVVITLDYDTLTSNLGTARLDTGEPVSAALARRLACEAGIIPTVIRRMVDGTSVVLDMGHERRLHTKHMRIALGIQQGGCTTEGCDRPPGWCQAHHDLPYSHGGPTSVTNGRLLCSYHHTRAHASTHDMTRLPTGQVRFTRRT